MSVQKLAFAAPPPPLGNPQQPDLSVYSSGVDPIPDQTVRKLTG